jgi:hypothetical protein
VKAKSRVEDLLVLNPHLRQKISSLHKTPMDTVKSNDDDDGNHNNDNDDEEEDHSSAQDGKPWRHSQRQANYGSSSGGGGGGGSARGSAGGDDTGPSAAAAAAAAAVTEAGRGQDDLGFQSATRQVVLQDMAKRAKDAPARWVCFVGVCCGVRT